MKTNSLHHVALAAVALCAAGFALAPALAQEAPRWTPGRESVTITAKANRNYRVVLSSSHLGEAIMVSASIPVPYHDLDLTKEQKDQIYRGNAERLLKLKTVAATK